jgi:hypothetical protein
VATIQQIPDPTIVTVVPPTVQTSGVAEAKLTASPELAVAASANGAAPKDTSLRAPNAMVWIEGITIAVADNVYDEDTLEPLLSQTVTAIGKEPAAEVLPYISQAAASKMKPAGNAPVTEHQTGGVPPAVPIGA